MESDVIDGLVYRSIIKTEFNPPRIENCNSNILLPTGAEEIHDKIKIEADHVDGDNYDRNVKMKYSEYTKSSSFNVITPMNKIPTHICTVCNESFAKISHLRNHLKTHFEVELFSYKKPSMGLLHHNKDHLNKSDDYQQPRPLCEQVDDSHIKIETDLINGYTFTSIINKIIDYYPPTEKLNSGDQVQIEANSVICDTHGADGTSNNDGSMAINDIKCTESSTIDITAPINKTFTKICTVCRNESFNKTSKLKKHMKTHIKVKIISRKINLRNRSTVNSSKNFQCNICNKSYSEMSRIQKHMETHTEETSITGKKRLLNKSTFGIDNENKFICDECDKCFPSLLRLNTHVRIIHEKTRTKQKNNISIKSFAEYDACQNPYSINQQAENSLGHMEINNDIVEGNTLESTSTKEYNSISSCNTCISKNMINDKIKIEAVIVDNSTTRGGDDVINTEKNDDFVSSKRLNADAVASKNKESTKTCVLCNKSFFKKSMLRKHMEIHMMDGLCTGKKHSANDAFGNAEKKFKCLVCDKRFTASSTMKIHTRIFHTEKKIYRCNICHKQFSDMVYLKRHKKYHDEKPHQCAVCQKSFPLMSNLKLHMNVHAGIKPWKCNVCERYYADRTSFKKHMQYHNEGYSFKCNICNRVLKRRNCSKKHMISHSNEKNHPKQKYKCNVCQKSYDKPFILKRHMVIHTGEKQFTCDICKKSFAVKAHMKRHIIINHMQENKFKCHTCNKFFSDAYYFKVHQTLHANSKPYECHYCKKLFSHRTFLIIHLRNHRIRHECKICKTLYPQKKLLKTHMKLRHSD